MLSGPRAVADSVAAVLALLVCWRVHSQDGFRRVHTALIFAATAPANMALINSSCKLSLATPRLSGLYRQRWVSSAALQGIALIMRGLFKPGALLIEFTVFPKEQAELPTSYA